MRRFAGQRLASSLPGFATCVAAAARHKSSSTSEPVFGKSASGGSEPPVKPAAAAAAPPRRSKNHSGAAKATSTKQTGEELMASILSTLSSLGPVDQKPPHATSDVKSVAASTPKPKRKPANARPQRKRKVKSSVPAKPERSTKPLAAKAKRPANLSSTANNARLAKSARSAAESATLDVPVSDPPPEPPAPPQQQQQQQQQQVDSQPSDPVVARDEPVRVLVLVPGFLVLELARQPPPGVSAPFGRVVLASLDTCSSDSANRLKIGDPARCDLIVNPIHKHFAGANHLMAVNVRL